MGLKISIGSHFKNSRPVIFSRPKIWFKIGFDLG